MAALLPANDDPSVEKFIRQAFGKRVRELRTIAGWSQDELAEECGLHRTYVGGIERGERNPTLLIVKRIASALHVSLHELFSYDRVADDDALAKHPNRAS